MDLLKKYGPEELARMTCRTLKDKRNKEKRECDYYIDRKRAHYSKLNDSRKKMKIW